MYSYPSDHKIKFKVEPIDGKTLSECEFTLSLFVTKNKTLEYNKSECVMVDDNTYTVTFNTKDIGRGAVRLSLNIRVPNSDFEDGYKDINTIPICTGVEDV